MPAFLSIIIPTYNSFAFMKETLKSLESQSCKDFEVIISDDCSKDGTYLRLLEYSASASVNMRVYQGEENKGPGGARNLGLSKAIGEYVTFLDSDDSLDPDFVLKIKETVQKENCDCLIFDTNYLKEGKKTYVSSVPSMQETGTMDTETALLRTSTSIWGKAFKTKIIKENGMFFPEIMRYEDMSFSKRAIYYSKGAFYLKEALYDHKYREGSVMNDRKFDRQEDAMCAFRTVEEVIKNDYPEVAESFYALFCIYSCAINMASSGCRRSEIKKYITDTEKEYPDLYGNRYIKEYPFYVRRVLAACKHKNICAIRFYGFLKKKMGKN